VHASIQLTLHCYRDWMPSLGRNTANGIDEALGAGLTPLLPGAVQRSFEEASIPPPWEGFLASIGAGVNEEVLFRLGLMTLFVFLEAKLLRQGDRPAGVVWTAMVLATLLFGVVHLPQAAALGGGLPASLVASVLLGNYLGGVVFGWLYWKRGLLAAVSAHFAANIVLHVIAPVIGSI
jgi:membrane protease YdiL (CAAX protease family)